MIPGTNEYDSGVLPTRPRRSAQSAITRDKRGLNVMLFINLHPTPKIGLHSLTLCPNGAELRH
jgi:hypothetical protein